MRLPCVLSIFVNKCNLFQNILSNNVFALVWRSLWPKSCLIWMGRWLFYCITFWGIEFQMEGKVKSSETEKIYCIVWTELGMGFSISLHHTTSLRKLWLCIFLLQVFAQWGKHSFHCSVEPINCHRRWSSYSYMIIIKSQHIISS